MLDFKNKKYRLRNGNKYQFLTDERSDPQNIVGLRCLKDGTKLLVLHYPDGRYFTCELSEYDLVEVTPYDDFRIDDPVWAYASNGDQKEQRHFAGVSVNGNPMTFSNGGTSWTRNKWETEEWEFVEKHNEQRNS